MTHAPTRWVGVRAGPHVIQRQSTLGYGQGTKGGAARNKLKYTENQTLHLDKCLPYTSALG